MRERTHTTGSPHPSRGRRPAGRATLVALVATAAIALLGACTPEQFQQWWVDHGNAPLEEPALSQAAAAATAYWDEVAREARFVYEEKEIDAALAARMTPTSWRPGCPVPLADTVLRLVRDATPA